MKILFWGTPDFAIPSLRALMEEGQEVVGVVTRPDRPAGRGRRLRASPVREVAVEEGLTALTPERPRGPEFVAKISALEPDLSVVAAYGHILSPEVLEVPEGGSVNLHASLLPELRGAAPVNWAIMRGHDRTGVTIMKMTEGMDEGPILLQREVPIDDEDTATGLYIRLAEVGAEALVEALALMEAGLLEAREQDHDRATYAPKVDRKTARIDWNRPARAVANHIRGMDMVPGAWTLLDGQPVKLFGPRVQDRSSPVEDEPGVVLEASPDEGLVVATGEGEALRVKEAQPSGKRRMEVAAWLRGGGPVAGDRFQ